MKEYQRLGVQPTTHPQVWCATPIWACPAGAPCVPCVGRISNQLSKRARPEAVAAPTRPSKAAVRRLVDRCRGKPLVRNPDLRLDAPRGPAAVSRGQCVVGEGTWRWFGEDRWLVGRAILPGLLVRRYRLRLSSGGNAALREQDLPPGAAALAARGRRTGIRRLVDIGVAGNRLLVTLIHDSTRLREIRRSSRTVRRPG